MKTGHVACCDGVLHGKIVIQQTLSGILKGNSMIFGKLKDAGSLSGIICIPNTYDDYSGEYIIVPDFSDHSLETCDKHLCEDITVKSIPYSEVENPSGGLTINIGG